LIGRISERREFDRLNRHGRRARTNSLWCRYLDDAELVPPRVAFAIGRVVGPAVIRNRVRRRLRELLRSATVVEPPLLSHGHLLIGARPGVAELPFAVLRDELHALLRAVRTPPEAS
jgi:ribonuclease P protein component